MKWEKNIFRDQVVQKYKIKLPQSSKNGENQQDNKMLNDANIDKIQ